MNEVLSAACWSTVFLFVFFSFGWFALPIAKAAGQVGVRLFDRYINLLGRSGARLAGHLDKLVQSEDKTR